ncbi:MAG: hypothetical protein NWE79_06835 [Candidatus Bathyarchaeota archaeon]|nr:hypothetical protein [Candidatus Bathyarchaeota archaeon]
MARRRGLFCGVHGEGECPEPVVMRPIGVVEEDLAGLGEFVALHVELVKQVGVEGYVEPGTEALFDWVEYQEDREANFETPDLVNTWGYPTLSNRTWFSGNGTWLLRTAGLDTNMTIFIPTEWRSYFCEVKVDGAGHTNLGFTRSTRTLEVKGLSSSNVSISMVDPPEWMVNFAYWFGSATGISLLPLLKIWDRLAKRRRALPYIVALLGLVLMALAVWFTWQWIRFYLGHVSL